MTLTGTTNGSPSNAHVLLNPIASGVFGGSVLIGAGTAESGGAGDMLHVRGSDAANCILTEDAYGTSVNSILRLRSARGTFAAPSVTNASDTLGDLRFAGWQGGAFLGASAIINATAGPNNFTSTDHGSKVEIQTTPTGATSLTHSFGTGVVKQLTNNTIAGILGTLIGANAAGMTKITLNIQVTNGTDTQTAVGEYVFGAVNKAGTLTLINAGGGFLTLVDANAAANKALSAGTLTVTPAVFNGGTFLTFEITANSSLAGITRMTCSYTYVNMSDGDAQVQP